MRLGLRQILCVVGGINMKNIFFTRLGYLDMIVIVYANEIQRFSTPTSTKHSKYLEVRLLSFYRDWKKYSSLLCSTHTYTQSFKHLPLKGQEMTYNCSLKLLEVIKKFGWIFISLIKLDGLVITERFCSPWKKHFLRITCKWPHCCHGCLQ